VPNRDAATLRRSMVCCSDEISYSSRLNLR
jgi:hypothetical protein